MSIPNCVCVVRGSKPRFQYGYGSLMPVPDWYEVQCGADMVGYFVEFLGVRYNDVTVSQ